MRAVVRLVLLAIAALAAVAVARADDYRPLDVHPPAVLLDGPESSDQLLVSLPAAENGRVDATRDAEYTVIGPA